MQEKNVLILGENSLNNYISGFFADKGINPIIVSDVYKLRSLSGEVGSFTIHLKDNNIDSEFKDGQKNVDFVILTEQPAAEPAVIDGLPAKSLYRDAVANETSATEPVVFLLDYIDESPMAATIYALRNAVRLARNKRQVYYLAKFIRTMGHGIEALYKDAREAGVTFIKYEDLRINADQNEEEFLISVSDGEAELDVKTKHVYADAGLGVGERFDYAAKKLNLTATELGFLTEDRYFLTPALTSRRGVYHLTRDLIAERLNEGLEYIYALVKSGLRETPSFGIAEIDGKKCVFCYNCYRACPHAALEPDSSAAQMQCLSGACEGCGICAGLCPANAITLEMDSLSVFNDSNAEKALIIYCENSGGSAVDNTDGIDALSVPCGGLIDIGRLTENLCEYEKIMAVVCPDDACLHFDGNKRACACVKRLSKMLETAGLTTDRIRIVQVSALMPKVMQEEIHDYC